MKILVCINISFIAAIMYYSYLKGFHPLETIFLWMILIFSYTSLMAMIVDNVEYWKLSKRFFDHTTFKLVKLVGVPYLIMFFVNQMFLEKAILKKLIILAIGVSSLLVFEWTLQWSEIIKHTKWNYFNSAIMWTGLIVYTLGVHHLFRRVLIKEGVVSS